MEHTSLSPDIYNSHEFFQINENLIKWNLESVQGEGFFKKYTGKYAHIKIKMYASKEYDWTSSVIWNVDKKLLPDSLGHKMFIEKVLNFFLTYLSGLRGERIHLTFEINDGTYHPVDSQAGDFLVATVYALINCFDKNFNMLRPSD
ncbi:MAG TPA: hypothetical protein VIG72_10780, partial [Pontibacter sp.]